jgi:quercetin dioxygenase-like cupin family protein
MCAEKYFLFHKKADQLGIKELNVEKVEGGKVIIDDDFLNLRMVKKTYISDLGKSIKIPPLAHSHDFDESFVLVSGKAFLAFKDKEGNIQRFELSQNKRYDIPANIPHQAIIIDGVLEVFFPVFDKKLTEVVTFNYSFFEERKLSVKVIKHSTLPTYKADDKSIKILVDPFTCDTKNLSLGLIKIPPHSKTEDHIRNVDEIIYVLKGEADVFVFPEERYHLQAGDVIFIPQGKKHRHENNTNQVLEQLWIFSPSGPETKLRGLPIE